MQQVSGVQVLQSLEYLVNDVLLVHFFQDPGPDYLVEVRFHELEHQVNVSVVFRTQNVEQSDDILMVQLLQKHNLAERPLGVCVVLERGEDLLESDYFVSFPVDRLPDDPVRALADALDYLVLPQHVLVDLLVVVRLLRH